MSHRSTILLSIGLLLSASAGAQDSLTTHITYDLTTEASVGSGDFTAYQLTANRHHVMATRPNTAYLRTTVCAYHPLSTIHHPPSTIHHPLSTIHHPLSTLHHPPSTIHHPLSTLTLVADIITSVHADHRAYLQQCYANLTYHSFFIEAGSREEKPVLRDQRLSSGALIKGANAKPMPQIHFGTNDFWTVPFTKDWLQINFDFGYGRLLDGSYREDAFYQASQLNAGYATDISFHQKHLYFRSNPAKRFFVTAGMEHYVQFGGKGYKRIDDVVVSKTKPSGLKAFLDVVLPLGDSKYYEHDAMEDWIFGNHLGQISIQLGWNINREHLIEAYVDNPFEDGSGMRKGNGWDGLWGLQYHNKANGRQYLRAAVLEYLQTTNQSGPLHWDGNDFPAPIRDQITDFVTGNDNYYNHTLYSSYTHYGMTPGSPLITSPIYNKNGVNTFIDNRVKAWHLAFEGELTHHLSYMAKGSYREGWGTYWSPLPDKHHSFDAMLQGLYHSGPWQLSAAYAFDKGNIFGDCSTLNIKIGYHGKIL